MAFVFYKRTSWNLILIWVKLDPVDYISNFVIVITIIAVSISHKRKCNFPLSLPFLIFFCNFFLFRNEGGRGNGKDSYSDLSFTNICIILSCAVGSGVCCLASFYPKHEFLWLSIWKLCLNAWILSFLSVFSLNILLLHI